LTGRAAVAAAGAALVLATAAAAHGPAGGGVGYVSSISGLKPPVVGVLTSVLGGDDRLQLVNYSGKTIVVYGYEGEPFLRFTSNGVYENVRSPSTYLSREREPAQAHVPAFADPSAAPRWQQVTRGPSFAWHDQRIHWIRSDLPPVVQQAPDDIHLIFRWRVPASADGKRFAVTGFLGYRPAPSEGDDGTNEWLMAGLAVAGALVLAALGLGARRVIRRAP
jgi:hypothetical protein